MRDGWEDGQAYEWGSGEEGWVGRWTDARMGGVEMRDGGKMDRRTNGGGDEGWVGRWTVVRMGGGDEGWVGR